LNCVDPLVGTTRTDIAQVRHSEPGSQAEQRANRRDAELHRARRIKTKSLHYFRLHLLIEGSAIVPRGLECGKAFGELWDRAEARAEAAAGSR
jgi:hypothetical protein